MESFKRDIPGISLLAEPKDDHYHVVLGVTKNFVSKEMDKHWRAVRKNIKHKGFRNGHAPRAIVESLYGGRKNFYAQIFSHMLNEHVMKAAPQKVILTANHEVNEVDDGSWVSEADVWLESPVVEKKSLESMSFKLPQPDIDAYVQNRMESFAKVNPYLHNKVDAEDNPLKAEDWDMVEVSIEAILNGRRFPAACEKATNVRLVREAVWPREMYDTLIGALPGQFFKLKPAEAPPAYRKEVGKGVFEMEIQLNRVYRCEAPPIDEDLAITAGFDSMESWKVSLIEAGQRSADHETKVWKRELVLAELGKRLDLVEPLPKSWVEAKINELVTTGRASVKSTAELNHLYSEVSRVAVQYTLLKFVGKTLNIEWEDSNKDIYERDEDKYCEKVLEHLVSKAEYTYVDPTPAEIGGGSAQQQTQQSAPLDRA